MLYKWKASVVLWVCAVPTLNALTLHEGVNEVLSTNPVIQERLHNYRAALEDLRITEAQYLPTLNYTGTLAQERKILNKKFETTSKNSYDHSLQLTQNLFNGFGTHYESAYSKARILAAAYSYVENANDTAFNFVTAYINAVKARDVVEIVASNVVYHQDILKKVEKLFTSGLITRSEVEKAQTSLALAQSNLVVSQNGLDDAMFNLERVYGKQVKVQELQEGSFSGEIPNSLEEMREYAKLHNPSVLVNDYNIKAETAQRSSLIKEYYPSIDAFARQSWLKEEGLAEDDARVKVGVTLNYNLYNGGSDEAKIQKSLSKINQESQSRQNTLRKLDEQGSLSWSARNNISKQLIHLNQYETTSKKTLALYEKEYDLGRRTLLDLTTAQNDHISAQTQIVRAQNDLLLAHYRILNAMGTMVSTLLGTQSDVNFQKVGLKLLDNRLDNDERVENLIFADRKVDKYKKDIQQ